MELTSPQREGTRRQPYLHEHGDVLHPVSHQQPHSPVRYYIETSIQAAVVAGVQLSVHILHIPGGHRDLSLQAGRLPQGARSHSAGCVAVDSWSYVLHILPGDDQQPLQDHEDDLWRECHSHMKKMAGLATLFVDYFIYIKNRYQYIKRNKFFNSILYIINFIVL